MILAESMLITASRSLSVAVNEERETERERRAFQVFTVTLPVRTEESTLTPGGHGPQRHQQPSVPP